MNQTVESQVETGLVLSIKYPNREEWLAHNPSPNSQLVHLSRRAKGGHSEIFFEEIYEDMGIAEAAETATALYLSQEDRFPNETIFATVYWPDGKIWGPFPMEVIITVEATELRQGD